MSELQASGAKASRDGAAHARQAAREARVFRRAKRTPDQDLWHTLAVGIPIGLLLLILLPIIFNHLL